MRTPWKLQNLGRWAGLLALSVGVTVLVFLGVIVLLAWQTGEGQASSLGALRDVSQALTQEADAFLLRRALNNLLLNAARHAPPGSVICLGVTNSVGAADPCGPPSPTCVLWVENQTGQAQAQPSDQDGGAPHGTGRKLVSQIAQAHGGRAVFSDGTRFRGEIWLPVGDKKQALRVWRA